MDLQQTEAYIASLTGDPNSVMDWRVIHDSDKGQKGRNIRGSLHQVQNELVQYNQEGWGVFVTINQMDGQGHSLENVHAIRTHVIDLDDPETSVNNFKRAADDQKIPPHFYVNTSKDKFHVYWLVEPYAGNDFYSLQQRKLAQLYNGDKSVIDASRVLRVPGFYHMKNRHEPYLVNCGGLGQHPRHNSVQIDQALSHINIEQYVKNRHDLGTKEMAAPSLELLEAALNLIDPNTLSREKWVAVTAAFKQAAWTLTTPEEVHLMWLKWCERYDENDQAENEKNWRSIRDTQAGWGWFKHNTHIKAYIDYSQPITVEDAVKISKMRVGNYNKGEILEAQRSLPDILDKEQMEIWFDRVYYVAESGEIFTANKRFMKQQAFTAYYGGKLFINRPEGKMTDDAWKAVTRNPVFSIPKVDHIRFLPQNEPYSITYDAHGRAGLNIYVPPKIDRIKGDVSRFLWLYEKILPDPGDRKILFDWVAHAIQFPGEKLRWSPLLQSTQGTGKGFLTQAMIYAVGEDYTHIPNPNAMKSSNNQFNAWGKEKILIVCDEIDTKGSSHMTDILKQVVSEQRMVFEAKGKDQTMCDNAANWIFTYNGKDNVKVDIKERRFCPLFSALQTPQDIIDAGLTDEFFKELFDWFKDGGGKEAIAYYFMYEYKVKKNGIGQRAPKSTSWDEFIKICRSPIEVVLDESIENQVQGFRNGFVSMEVLHSRCKMAGIRYAKTDKMDEILKAKSYVPIGKTIQPIMVENPSSFSDIYSLDKNADVSLYPAAQGYNKPYGQE